LGICTAFGMRFTPPAAKLHAQNPSSSFVECSIRNILYESSTPHRSCHSCRSFPCSAVEKVPDPSASEQAVWFRKLLKLIRMKTVASHNLHTSAKPGEGCLAGRPWGRMGAITG
jgi:hypothetical protein